LAAYIAGLPQILSWGLSCGAIALGIAFVLPSRYAVSVSFISAEADATNPATGGLTALASRFGIGPSAQAQSPEFYTSLLATRSIVDPVLLDTIRTSQGQLTSLLDFLHVKGDSLSERLERGAKKLVETATTTSVDDQTGIVTLLVELRDSRVAADVAMRLVARLDSFNLVTRQSEARARAQFLEVRLGSAQRDLARAEDSLRSFYERNRRIADSPALQFEEGRLKRVVDLRQQVFLTLNQEYEQARIDQVRDTPVLTILQPAIVPTKRAWPKRGVSAVAGFIAGVLLAGALTAWREITSQSGDARDLALDLRVAFENLRQRFRRRKLSA